MLKTHFIKCILDNRRPLITVTPLTNLVYFHLSLVVLAFAYNSSRKIKCHWTTRVEDKSLLYRILTFECIFAFFQHSWPLNVYPLCHHFVESLANKHYQLSVVAAKWIVYLLVCCIVFLCFLCIVTLGSAHVVKMMKIFSVHSNVSSMPQYTK